MRTRTQNDLSNAVVTSSDYLPNGTLQTSSTSTSSQIASGRISTITDTNHKAYEKRSRGGEVFMDGVSLNRTTCRTSFPGWTFGTHPVWGSRRFKGDYPAVWSANIVCTYPAAHSVAIEDAKKATLVAAHSKVASADVSSMVTVAEFRETVSMMARPFGKADNLLNRMIARRTKLIRRGLSFGAAASSAWLEYRLGWKPLLYEIQQYTDAYTNRNHGFSKPTRLAARSSKTLDYSGESVWNGAAGGLTTLQIAGRWSKKTRVSAGVLYELHDESEGAGTRRSLGLRLSDVPSSLWEAIPLSFVVDRFVNVGQWLNAVVPKPGVRVLGYWSTVITEETKTAQAVKGTILVNTTPVTTYTCGGGDYEQKTFSYNRTINPPLPLLPPVNRSELSVEQNLDHAALIATKLLDFFRK